MVTGRVTKGFGVFLILMIACLGMAKAQSSTMQVVEAANKFIATLSEEQRHKVVYAYGDAKQRARWSNFPTGFVPRGGMSLKEMNEAQRTAALALMQTVLSPMGYEKMNQIRLADDDFKTNGSRRGPGGGGPPPGGPGGPGGRPPFASADTLAIHLVSAQFPAIDQIKQGTLPRERFAVNSICISPMPIAR